MSTLLGPSGEATRKAGLCKKNLPGKNELVHTGREINLLSSIILEIFKFFQSSRKFRQLSLDERQSALDLNKRNHYMRGVDRKLFYRLGWRAELRVRNKVSISLQSTE